MIYVLNLVLFILFLLALYLLPAGDKTGVLANPLITFGVVMVGANISARSKGKSKLIVPDYPFLMGQSLLGGILMGIGLNMAALPELSNVLAMVHGVFYWVSFLLPQGFVYLTGMLIGGGAALSLQKHIYPQISWGQLTPDMQNNIAKLVKPLLAGIFLVVAVFSIKTIFSGDISYGLISISLALSAGFLLERNRICMGLLMKETLWTKSRATLLKVLATIIVLGVIWSTLGIGAPLVNELTLLLLLGSFLMGFGYIMSDGCFMGSLWKAGQGNLASFLSILGIFVGAAASSVKINFSHAAQLPSGIIQWQMTTVKIGLIILLVIWPGAYFMERPNKIVRWGSIYKWLLSEATIMSTMSVILIASKYTFSYSLQVVSAFIYISGILLYTWARICLGRNWGEAIVIRAGHQIVTSGPYRYLKHPIYVSIILILTGATMLLNSLWGLTATFLLVMPLLILRAGEEQRILKDLPGGKEYFTKI